MFFTSTKPGSTRLLTRLRSGCAVIFPRLKINDNAAQDAVQGCLFCLKYSADQNDIMIETENFYARYDNFPATPGHIEIVPKRHVESFFELSCKEISQAYDLMSRAKKKIDVKYDPDGYTIGVNEGDAAGRSISHLHIHLIPRHSGDVEDPRGGIRQVVPNWDPDLWRSGKSLLETSA